MKKTIDKYLNEGDYDSDLSINPDATVMYKKALKKFKLKSLQGLKGKKAEQVLDYMEKVAKDLVKKGGY